MSVINIKLTKSKVTLEILNIIELNPGTFGSAIAKQLHLDHKTIKYHVDKLIEGDLITTKKQGKKNLLYPKWGTLHEFLTAILNMLIEITLFFILKKTDS